MRILMTNPSEITMPGGVHEVIRKLSEGLTERGHEVTVLQFNPQKKQNIEIMYGFRVIRVSTVDFYGLSIRALKTLSQLLTEWKPDIIHVHGYHTLFSPAVIMKIKKTNPDLPVVFSPHYGPYGHNTLAGKYLWNEYNKIIGRKLFKMVDIIVVASNFEKMSVLHDIPWDNGSRPEIVVIPHGVEFVFSKKYRIIGGNQKVRLLFAGYLIKLKGVHYLIQALSELVYRFNINNIELTIIGDGPYKSKLKTLAEKLKVEDYIKWKDFVDHCHLLKEMKNSDIFLLLSENENYGIVVAEALALGVPVIVTDNSALHEFIYEKGCFGVKYPPNPREIASTILHIIKKPPKVGPFTKKIRTWKEVVDDYERIYKNLVRKK